MRNKVAAWGIISFFILGIITDVSFSSYSDLAVLYDFCNIFFLAFIVYGIVRLFKTSK